MASPAADQPWSGDGRKDCRRFRAALAVVTRPGTFPRGSGPGRVPTGRWRCRWRSRWLGMACDSSTRAQPSASSWLPVTRSGDQAGSADPADCGCDPARQTSGAPSARQAHSCRCSRRGVQPVADEHDLRAPGPGRPGLAQPQLQARARPFQEARRPLPLQIDETLGAHQRRA